MTKNTPRIFISLLLMLLCIGILPVSAFASGGDYPDDALPTAESSAADTQETKQIGTVTTNGGNLNVRTGAGLDNTAFTQLPNGTVVDVIGRDGDWVKILLPARVGYVYGSYLTVTDAADSTVSIGGITLPFDEKELADLWQLLVGSMTGGSDALTPDGNLTLIDDIGSSTKAGKQFITLESKNGNVFYMGMGHFDCWASRFGETTTALELAPEGYTYACAAPCERHTLHCAAPYYKTSEKHIVCKTPCY